MTEQGLELLYKASFLPENHFICFGKYFFELRKLELIDDENQVTNIGRQFIRYAIKKGYLENVEN